MDRIGSPIENKDLNLAGMFWFGFINNTIMSSKSESILRSSKTACLVCIISRQGIDLWMPTSQEMDMRTTSS